MDITGIGLSAEARTVTQRIVKRVESFRQGRKAFKGLSDSLGYLTGNIEKVDEQIGSFPHGPPQDIWDLFRVTLERVRDTLRKADATTETEFSEAFGGSGGGVVSALKWKGYRIVRAKALMNRIYFVETQVKEASIELLQLISVLAHALKFDSVNVAESA